MAQNQELQEKLARLKAIAADSAKTTAAVPAATPSARPPMVSPGFRNPHAPSAPAADPPAAPSTPPAVPALSALLRQEDPPEPPPTILDDGIPVLTRELTDEPLEATVTETPPQPPDVVNAPLETAALPVDIDAAFERHFLRPQALRNDSEPSARPPLAGMVTSPDHLTLLTAARLQTELNQALTRILQDAVTRFTIEAAAITARILQEDTAGSAGQPDAPPPDRV